jgi:hypothetical protein
VPPCSILLRRRCVFAAPCGSPAVGKSQRRQRRWRAPRPEKEKIEKRNCNRKGKGKCQWSPVEDKRIKKAWGRQRLSITCAPSRHSSLSWALPCRHLSPRSSPSQLPVRPVSGSFPSSSTPDCEKSRLRPGLPAAGRKPFLCSVSMFRPPAPRPSCIPAAPRCLGHARPALAPATPGRTVRLVQAGIGAASLGPASLRLASSYIPAALVFVFVSSCAPSALAHRPRCQADIIAAIRLLRARNRLSFLLPAIAMPAHRGIGVAPCRHRHASPPSGRSSRPRHPRLSDFQP